MSKKVLGHDPALGNLNVLIDNIERDNRLNVQSMIDRLVRIGRQNFGRPPTCATCTQPGCCYITNAIFLHEAFPIARNLRLVGTDSPAFRAELRVAGEQMEAFSRGEWIRKRIPCTFLVDNRCSIYALRPVVCSSYFVWSDARQCQPELDGNVLTVDTKMLLVAMMYRQNSIFENSFGIPFDKERVYIGSLQRMVALSLELFAWEGGGDIKDFLANEPFPTATTIEEWLEGQNPFGDRRRAHENQRSLPGAPALHHLPVLAGGGG